MFLDMYHLNKFESTWLLFEIENVIFVVMSNLFNILMDFIYIDYFEQYKV